MITSKEEALELCKKFDVKLSEHKTVIVTGNNSIYLSDNIDPADKSEKFFLKGGTISIEAEKAPKKPVEKPKEEAQPEISDEKELTDKEIENQIEAEEKELKGKKSKK